ncbi:MAG: UDP-4-amino-4,6-dideoxy-N-acetyl-beta-L-altrosamine transaminase [Aquificae bacterium]|nr:UDP-4-amino-4,6-dideoxy-N-acetyl-beta-L-altrosamine transaminase [Aquificota bacterium]
MVKEFIPYGRQYIDDEDIKEVIKVLKSDFITQGPTVEKFERALAEYCGAKYCVVFNSGTSALIGAYFAVGLSAEDSFITSPITFVATANAGLVWGAKPIFVDVEPDTGNIDADLIEEKLEKNTKLIVPVHYAGHPTDMEKVRQIADRNNLFVIEDACHALGAKYKNSPVGACKYSDACIFSFHPVKHITTGEGGAVLTNDITIYKRLKLVRNHGITKSPSEFIFPSEGAWYYEQHHLGFNFRMTDFQAALGISQLRKLSNFVSRRREIAKIYNETFKGNPYFDLPPERVYAYHSYHLYPIRLKESYRSRKREIFDLLRKEGLGVQVHYIPVYWQPYYHKLGYKRGECPMAEEFYKSEISLPIFPSMDDKTVKEVINRVNKVFQSLD